METQALALTLTPSTGGDGFYVVDVAPPIAFDRFLRWYTGVASLILDGSFENAGGTPTVISLHLEGVHATESRMPSDTLLHFRSDQNYVRQVPPLMMKINLAPQTTQLLFSTRNAATKNIVRLSAGSRIYCILFFEGRQKWFDTAV